MNRVIIANSHCRRREVVKVDGGQTLSGLGFWANPRWEGNWDQRAEPLLCIDDWKVERRWWIKFCTVHILWVNDTGSKVDLRVRGYVGGKRLTVSYFFAWINIYGCNYWFIVGKWYIYSSGKWTHRFLSWPVRSNSVPMQCNEMHWGRCM